MRVQSSTTGFTESYLKTNMFEKIQNISVVLPKPENVNIEILNNFQFKSKYKHNLLKI